MRINEIFYSLQGEGRLAGTPSAFIRLAGCPLRCKWCDTKFAWNGTAAVHYSIARIVESIEQYKTSFVVITGGEPMVDSDLPQLASCLKDKAKHITIETAGIAFVADVPCDLMSISPKLSNSIPDEPHLSVVHENSRLDIAVLGELIEHYPYQLKFVVDSEADLDEIHQTIEQLPEVELSRVLLMPQARTRQQLLAKSPMVAQMCKQTGFGFSQRLQILLWDNQRGC